MATKLEVQSSDTTAAKAQLQKLRDQTTHMRYGECWTEALEILQVGCRRLTDETQRRIAYAFARCHLQASGRDIPECPDNVPISDCTGGQTIPDIAFNAYTEFFTHTQQICFHLQSQAWHEATENTISKLADNSEEVANHLEHSSTVAQEMIARQNVSLKNQEMLLKNEERLKMSMEKSVLDVQRSHTETKAIINEQRALFSEVFDRVAVLQKTVLGEFSSIYTFGFYVGSTLLAYILTSTTRTSSARIWLFLILMVNAITEHMITQYYINPLESGSSYEIGSLAAFIPELIYEQTWLCRKIFCGLGFFILLVCIFRYKDYNIINNALLNDIKRQNENLQNYIRDNIHDSTIQQGKNAAGYEQKPLDVASGKKMLLEKHQSDISSVATLSHNQSNITVSELNSTLKPMDSSAIQNISDSGSETDNTYQDSESPGHDSDISSVTSIISVSSRSTNSGMRRQVTAHIRSTRRSSTPLRETSFVDHERSSSVKRRGRRSDVSALLNDTELSFCESPANGVIVGGYNLRRRPASPLVHNPIIKQESAKDFTDLMQDLASQSTSRRRQITQHLKGKK